MKHMTSHTVIWRQNLINVIWSVDKIIIKLTGSFLHKWKSSSMLLFFLNISYDVCIDINTLARILFWWVIRIWQTNEMGIKRGCERSSCQEFETKWEMRRQSGFKKLYIRGRPHTLKFYDYVSLHLVKPFYYFL